MIKYRFYSTRGTKRNVLVSWIDKHCLRCGQFLNKHRSRSKTCVKCARENYLEYIRKYGRIYYHNHKEKLRERHRKYYHQRVRR